jgi:alpha-mannosidase
MQHKKTFTIEKISRRLELVLPRVYQQQELLPAFQYTELADSSEPFPPDPEGLQWTEIPPHSYWGRWETSFVLKTTFTIPAEWNPSLPTALYLPLGEAGDFSHPEALVYIDGTSYAACDRHHQEIHLKPDWADGKPHTLLLHGWTGLGGWRGNGAQTQLYMRPCSIVQIHEPLRKLTILARIALDTARNLAEDHPTRDRLLNALDHAFKHLDTREPLASAFYASVPPVLELLEAGIAQAGPAMDVLVHAAGHAHIDVAWLWTLAQTRQKARRTFHTVLRMMEQHPEYRFTQSQPQLYDYIRQDQPELFEAIQARVAEGRWETIGGMWVEADCNVTGSESLARQFILGRGFFRRYFGADAETPVLWLPDVFGYAWALPQLIRQAGLEYFMTIKIGWSQFNRLPYDSFWWQGIDGTRVLTHFSTTPEAGSQYASTYNAKADPQDALGTWRNFQQKELHRSLLMAYGYGDVGGGPTREMIENIAVMEAFPGLPQVRYSSVRSFFEALEHEAGGQLPTWNGELYLEYHRGTYTTQARNKRANRKSEFLLHDSEFLAAFAAQVDPGYTYPSESLNQAWEWVCLNQFHDIIPGSSIGPVYTESLQQYAAIREIGEQVQAEALAALAAQMGGHLLAVNPTSFPSNRLVLWKDPHPSLVPVRDGVPLPVQSVAEGLLLDPGELPPYSLTPLSLAQDTAALPRSLSVSPTHLENDFLRVELNASGDITRIFDKQAEREVLPPGSIANEFQAFEDRPLNWDAWDIDIFYEDRQFAAEPAEAVRVAETGPLRAALEIKRQILNSPYTQRIVLAHNSRQIDIHTRIDWQERHILLKAAFPADILAPQASYEIQWGSVQRPTHHNTSWDWARFETCAQKWVDLSEGGYGVSLLNDCKYGHDIRDNVIRITLLRSPTNPDPEADQGEHEFTYSIFPHAGGPDGQTARAAYLLNDPPFAATGNGASAAPQGHQLLSCAQSNIIIETVKQAEDGRGLIVRLYESQRRRGKFTLTTGFPLASAWETNLLEEDEAPLDTAGAQVFFSMRPFQIRTIRLLPAQT